MSSSYEMNDMSSTFEVATSELYGKEIRRRNITLLRYFCYFGITVSGLGAITRLTLREGNLLEPFCAMLGYFVLLLFTHKQLLRLFRGNATYALYVAQVPAWIIALLLGSVLDPNNRTVTLFLFIALLPVFILDNPIRVIGFNFVWMVSFGILGYVVKPLDVYLIDLSFLVMFGAASLTTTYLLLAERLDAVKMFVESEQHARLDARTGLKNRYALEQDRDAYLNKDLIMGQVSIDDLAFYESLYGHRVGERILRAFAQSMQDAFGSERVYCYTNEELLLVLPGMDPVEFVKTYHVARNAFFDKAARDFSIRPAASAGYVYGCPKSLVECVDMVDHADICLSEACHAGRQQIRGAAYDRMRSRPSQMSGVLGGNLQSDSVDALTGLPNMQAFTVRAHSLLDAIESRGVDVVLIYFDLENFKQYNEEHGFQKGDDLLRSIADILRSSFPERLVGRFGDDHFAVMCYEDDYEECLTKALNAAFELHGKMNMPLRAGVYLYRDHTEDVSVACDRAKTACNSVKNRYDVFWRVYDNELREAEERRSYIISHIDDAINNGWLRVFYQPIVSAQTGEVVECEALVRWIDPTYGFMPPFAFIGELERAHLIHKVDMWIAERVCKDYRERVDAGYDPLPVSINLSRLDFVLCDVEETLLGFTDQYGVVRGDLHVEVTESAISDDFNQLVGVTNSLRERGFEIWLDDFGSDYSSLTTLKDFPCDVIKLDMMFLRSSDDNDRSKLIIQQMIELVAKLGARSLVEGVEEQRHLDFLAANGCDLAQGYLISKPEPLQALVDKGLIAGDPSPLNKEG